MEFRLKDGLMFGDEILNGSFLTIGKDGVFGTSDDGEVTFKNGKKNGPMKIYDENDLQVAKNDRETMLEGITVVAHLDLDYVVDEKTGETFLDLINNTFDDIIKEKYGLYQASKR